MWLVKRKSGFALAMAVVLVGLLTACGGGGGGQAEFDFNGTWTYNSTIVQSNVPGFPVGLAGIDVVRITQTGTGINAIIAGVPPMIGTCDPFNGTFSATGLEPGVVVTISATALDDYTMAGELTITNGPQVIRFQGTLQLVNRDRSAAGATSSGIVGRSVSGATR